MRPIKFRAWKKLNDGTMAMLPPELLDDTPFWELWSKPTEPPIFMQFTGINDIYEGDLIDTSHDIGWGVVEYVGAEFVLKRDGMAVSLTMLYKNNWKLNVVGNKFENAEELARRIDTDHHNKVQAELKRRVQMHRTQDQFKPKPFKVEEVKEED